MDDEKLKSYVYRYDITLSISNSLSPPSKHNLKPLSSIFKVSCVMVTPFGGYQSNLLKETRKLGKLINKLSIFGMTAALEHIKSSKKRKKIDMNKLIV